MRSCCCIESAEVCCERVGADIVHLFNSFRNVEAINTNQDAEAAPSAVILCRCTCRGDTSVYEHRYMYICMGGLVFVSCKHLYMYVRILVIVLGS